MPTIDLTPAEAMVLLAPKSNHGREAIKVSLMWLLARRHLTATVTTARWFGKPSTQLSLGARAGAALPLDLREVMDTVASAGTGKMNDIVKAARKRFGTDLRGFENGFVHPSLIARGLTRSSEQKRRILFIPVTITRRERTPAGDAMSRQIEALFEDARRIPSYLDRSPAQAAALAASLGGLILLLPELRPHLNEIAAVMRRNADQTDATSYSNSTSDTASDTSGGSSAKHDDGTAQPGDIDIPDFDFDLSDPGLQDLDGFAASLDALDSSFDSSADSGGGGDSGGDGGDGGGD